jgi:hypothetical protein
VDFDKRLRLLGVRVGHLVAATASRQPVASPAADAAAEPQENLPLF